MDFTAKVAFAVTMVPGSRVSELLPSPIEMRRVPPFFGVPPDCSEPVLPLGELVQAASKRAPRLIPPTASTCRREASSFSGFTIPDAVGSSKLLWSMRLYLQVMHRPYR